MTKLKMTLPKEFMNFFYSLTWRWTKENIQKCKDYLEPYHPDARDCGGYKRTALLYGVPLEIVKWLIERGADVNLANTYWTPLFEYAGLGNYEVCKLLIEHGADVNIEDYGGTTALFSAADGGYYEIVNLLLKYGANPCHHSGNIHDNVTPLLYMLRHSTDSFPKKKMAITAEILVKAQREQGWLPDEEWKLAQKYIAQIWHNYNLQKDDLPKHTDKDIKDFHKENDYDAAMEKLYSLFEVSPVQAIIKHKGDMPITVDENLSISKQHQALWDFLVPNSGACTTIQWEVIRISGNIDNEINGNGGANWDREYKKMLNALLEFFWQGNALDKKDIQTLEENIKLINNTKAYACREAPEKLIELAVKWVKQNPTPIPLKNVNYRR